MQLSELRGYAERMGWTAVEYVEKASGKAGGRRPVMDQLMADARMKRIGTVIVWKLDRFGRSLRELVDRIMELDQVGVRFIAPQQGIDTDQRSSVSRLLLHVMAAFAEFERDLIRERVSAGLAEHRRAVEKGELGRTRHTRSGKDLPTGRPKRVFDRQKAVDLRSRGYSWRQMAHALKVPESTIRLALKPAS